MADIRVMRRTAEMMIAVGLLVVAMTAAAFAQDPTPTATPEPTAEATPVPAAEATLAATPEAALTAVPAQTPEPTPTATATPTPEPAVTATPEAVVPEAAPVLKAHRPQPTRRVRQAPTPPPEPTPTPPEQMTGASLTLCHFTDPGYVAVVISADQYSLYFEEEDDIIPAPPEGCGNITAPESYADDDVTGCHLNADGSYTFFSFPPGDLHGHEFDKGDMIPAPNSMCPAKNGEYVIPTVTATPTSSATATATPGDGDVEGTGEGDEEETEGTDDPCFGGCGEVEFDATTPSDGDVAGATENGGTPSQLPFTGFDLWLIAIAGLALTMMGAGLRLLAAQPPLGVTR
jgi:hypothetical protein